MTENEIFYTSKFLRWVVEVTGRWLNNAPIIYEAENEHSRLWGERVAEKLIASNLDTYWVLRFSLPERTDEAIHSPFCEKRNDISDMKKACLLSHSEFTRVKMSQNIWNSTEMRMLKTLSFRDIHGCFHALVYKGIQRKNKQTSATEYVVRLVDVVHQIARKLCPLFTKWTGFGLTISYQVGVS